MKDSLKYAILLLLVSFLIAALCCNSQVFESYTSYPFDKPDEEMQSIDNIKNSIFKYNKYINDNSSEQFHDINEFVKIVNENTNKREGIKYSKLLDSQPSFLNYRPFDSRIISRKNSSERNEKIIKGKEIKIDPGKKTETLLAQSLDPIVDGGLGSIENVSERSDRGEIYYNPNKCIGEWSEWNIENCGSDRNRCGIKFKKYNILSREINDKNGPGKPCDYYDGLIKYKYCDGDNADDYDSNMERCDMPNNICPCKLNDENSIVLNGENVYDLEDENCLFQLERNCICPKGYTHLNIKDICNLTPGVDCSIEEPGCVYTAGNDNIEEKCEIPPFINRETEDLFYEKYEQVDGKCKKKECICPNGTPIDDEICVIDGLELCDENKKCDRGYYMAGNPPKCIKQTEGDGVYKECSCLYGTARIEEVSTGELSRCDPIIEEESQFSKIRQLCSSTGCKEGYKISTGQALCNEYYPEDIYNNISCCIPKYDRCLIEEDDLKEKNIVRKNKDGLFIKLHSKSISELKDMYNEIDLLDDIDAEELLEKENSKLFLIENIIEYNTEREDKTCIKNIKVKDCYSDFKCSPGHSFLPSTEHSDENELRMIGCEIKDPQDFNNICRPIKNCAGLNVETLEVQINSGGGIYFIADGEECMFSSDILEEEIIKSCSETGGENCDGDGNIDYISSRCVSPENGITCGGNCVIDQVNKYYPTWNGSCVPVSCPVSEDIRTVYNLTNEKCSSININCGISNMRCKNDDYNVPSSDKLIYCPSPQKVDSNYLLNNYELINYGCALEPPEPTNPNDIRKKLRSQQDAALATSQAPSIDQENIGEEVDFTGSTEDMIIDLESDLEEQRIEAELQAENLGGGTGELTEQEMINASSTRLASFGTP